MTLPAQVAARRPVRAETSCTTGRVCGEATSFKAPSERLERVQLPARRVSVWEVLWGAANPDQLTGDDLEMWEQLTEAPRVPYHDPIEEEIARITRADDTGKAIQADEPVVRGKSGAG